MTVCLELRADTLRLASRRHGNLALVYAMEHARSAAEVAPVCVMREREGPGAKGGEARPSVYRCTPLTKFAKFLKVRAGKRGRLGNCALLNDSWIAGSRNLAQK